MKLRPFGPYTAAKGASVFFALLLWFNVATEETYNYKVNLPILYIEPTSNFILVNDPPREVQVYLSGTGKSLLAFSFGRLFDPGQDYAPVSLADYPAGSHRVSLDTGDIYIALGDNITVESILNNATFTIEIDTKTIRTIAVDVDSLPPYRLAEGLVLTGPPIAVPDDVVADGPTNMLRETGPIRISSLFPAIITLEDTVAIGKLAVPSPLIGLNAETVQVRFPVERLRTKLFSSVPVTLSGFPRSAGSVLSPDTLSVLIQGPESVVSLARAEDITVLVDYRTFRDLTANGDSLITPTVRYPSGITSASTTPVALRVTQTSL